MATILHLDASARTTRSLSRQLSRRFVKAWLAVRLTDDVISRDLAADPPPHVSEDWIAACFTPSDRRTAAMNAELAWSDRAIGELIRADVIVLGTPMYNYGMPSALKAWFDQIIRIGETFSFDLKRGDWPLKPLLTGKTLVVLSARGEFGFTEGGARETSNHLDPHIATCARYIGVAQDDIHTIAIEYQEFDDERHSLSRATAVTDTDVLARTLAKALPSVASTPVALPPQARAARS